MYTSINALSSSFSTTLKAELRLHFDNMVYWESDRFKFCRDDGGLVKRNNGDGLDYLRNYPKFNKLMNTCICCGSVRYKPELPDNLTTRDGRGESKTAFAQYIRRYFQPLKVDELSICEECQKVVNHNNII